MIQLIGKPLTKLRKQQFHTLCYNIVEAFVLMPEDVLTDESNAFADALQDYLDILTFAVTKEKTKQLRKETNQLIWAWNCFRNEVKNAYNSPISDLKIIGDRLQKVVSQFYIYHRPFEEKMEKINNAVNILTDYEEDIKLLGAASYIQMVKQQLPVCRKIADERKDIIAQNKGKSVKARYYLNKMYQTLLSSIENWLIINSKSNKMDDFVNRLNEIFDQAYQDSQKK